MCARLAAGSVIELCKEVAMNKLDSGIALIRPPGHHAQREKAKGYCIFNNIAIAVQELRRLKLAEKIMIVDWDIHHGNGIQEVFLEDPDVLYFSIHRHENGGFYPCSPDADTSVVGRNAGIGRNVNVAFERSGMNDGDYLHIFERLLLPMSKEFNPDFIIVACGFDAAQGDPVGKCYVTPECFSIMVTLVLNMANNGMGGRTAFVLEGGHDREASAYSALACIKAMLWIPFEDGPIVPKAVQKIARDPSSSRESSLGVPKDQHNKPNVGPQRPTDEPPKQELTKVLERYSYLPFLEDYHASKSGKAVVDRVISYHRQYWKCLQS
ncbi:Histone deacetylase 5 [Zancudomyces culisetae]|uniref:histone deacetylase n=1 Tax=Zancudomyces culisetae TaxID=1213189 RepID=A0A1R1PMR7_ZANCU|nr:Histone deacetylase 5 [Zancudomyces culisetae]|eukprot:OMH82172.1 Histone deacetylase 5 [Zancudomyces culisetae]